ncbi:MAG TPA: amidohydrolase [Vicinamibacterales bacterium]|jgi:predicted amidohydrolase YtcJ|nr:amidohydrolase [Vicinamibacterales bacterium]
MAARLTTYLVVAIVGATLIAGLIVGAQREDNEGPVDMIVHNAEVYTADDDRTMAEAVAIRGNQILRVGGEREILRLRRPQTQMIDARGATVLPGFNDAHAHLIAGGLDAEMIDLRDAVTAEEVQERVRDWAEANPDAPWVLGRGWAYPQSPGNQPSRQILDAAVRDRPVQLVSRDGRASWVNSAALRLAGVTRKTADPANGVVAKDSRTGEPTGLLKDEAMTLVGRLVPEPTPEEAARALRAAIAEAHANGVTSVQNPSADPDELELYAETRRSGDLNLRIYSALAVGTAFSDADRTRLHTAARRHPDDHIFKTGAVNITLDGAIENQTAALLAPYASRQIDRPPTMAADDLNRLVRLIDAEGWQVMTRASGDRAVRMALNAYAHAARSNPRPARGRRHRVEHADLVHAADLPRFGSLSVIASMQPLRGSPTGARLQTWLETLGPERALETLPYGSILAADGRLAFGSGWPAGSLNPLLGIHAAVTRTTGDGLPEGGWNPAQRLSLEAAIDAYTSGAAWASFDEQRKGSLAPGMLADLVVLSESIFDAPPSRLARTRVVVTILDGKVVYQRDRGTN